jgi:hypothetical protein
LSDHGTIYGLTNVASGGMGGYGDKRDEAESMMVAGVDLYGEKLPRELELVMPQLKVEGVLHEIPVIRFKHFKGPGLVPIIYNY